MALYGWSGPGKLRELGYNRASAPEAVEPEVTKSDQMKVHICTVNECNRRFKHPMMIARHFNANHDDLKEDKDSWRDHCTEIWEDPNGG